MKNAFTPELYQYAQSISQTEHPVLKALRERTATMDGNHMQITTDQGQFMAILAKLIKAKKYLEIGVFTGYSTLAVTLAMEDNTAQSFALDKDNRTMAVAQEYWEKAGVAHKIVPLAGEALTSLSQLTNEGHQGTFDMAFIDAQKSEYIQYFEYCHKLIKSGGLILIDNIFFYGGVLEQHPKPPAAAINKFNHYLKDLGVDYCILPIADGLTLVRKA